MSCPHGRHSEPATCSQCLDVPVTRVDVATSTELPARTVDIGALTIAARVAARRGRR